ncbi:hypothetical protein ABK040_016435 [Willaertia magna]
MTKNKKGIFFYGKTKKLSDFHNNNQNSQEEEKNQQKFQGIFFSCACSKEKVTSREAFRLMEKFEDQVIEGEDDIRHSIKEFVISLQEEEEQKEKAKNKNNARNKKNEEEKAGSNSSNEIQNDTVILNKENETFQSMENSELLKKKEIEKKIISNIDLDPQEWLFEELQMYKKGFKNNFEILHLGNFGGYIFIRIKKENISPILLSKEISNFFIENLQSEEEPIFSENGDRIYSEERNKVLQSNINKLFPITDCFIGTEENLKIYLKKLLEPKLQQYTTTMKRYSIHYKSHNSSNKNLDKKKVFQIISELMTLRHFHDEKNPSLEIYIFIIENYIYLGIYDECENYSLNIASLLNKFSNTDQKRKLNITTILQKEEEEEKVMIVKKRKKCLEIDGITLL